MASSLRVGTPSPSWEGANPNHAGGLIHISPAWPSLFSSCIQSCHLKTDGWCSAVRVLSMSKSWHISWNSWASKFCPEWIHTGALYLEITSLTSLSATVFTSWFRMGKTPLSTLWSLWSSLRRPGCACFQFQWWVKVPLCPGLSSQMGILDSYSQGVLFPAAGGISSWCILHTAGTSLLHHAAGHTSRTALVPTQGSW